MFKNVPDSLFVLTWWFHHSELTTGDIPTMTESGTTEVLEGSYLCICSRMSIPLVNSFASTPKRNWNLNAGGKPSSLHQ